MTFTSTPPTTTGFYAWKAREDISDEDVRGRRLIVLKKCTFKGVVDELSYEEPSEIKGLWCRLVPAGERDQLRAENKKLRDVAERLATHAHNHGLNPDASQRNICSRCCAIRDYNQLPHVKERHKE